MMYPIYIELFRMYTTAKLTNVYVQLNRELKVEKLRCANVKQGQSRKWNVWAYQMKFEAMMN